MANFNLYIGEDYPLIKSRNAMSSTITTKKIRTSIAIFNFFLRTLERVGFSLLSVPPYLPEQSDDWLEIEAQQALKQLVSNLEKQNISPVAKLYLQGEINRSIQNRKQISRYIQRYPALLNATIQEPIFIVGLPRTGTTALQNMLNQLQDKRALTLHELLSYIQKYYTLTSVRINWYSIAELCGTRTAIYSCCRR